MLPSERQKKMFDLLNEKKVVTIPEFIHTFNISVETVRRDLNTLAEEEKIQKVYGGAKVRESTFSEPTMENRLIDRLAQKAAIGEKCCEFIDDGDCVFIDSGSTTYQIAKHLLGKRNLTIITNSIPVINELMYSDFEVIVIGGKVRHTERSIVSFDYLFNFSDLNILKSFIGVGGITIENGISDFNMQEAVTRKTIIERSNAVYVAADSSKFAKDVTISIAKLDQIHCIITDSDLDKRIANAFKKTSSQLVLANYQTAGLRS